MDAAQRLSLARSIPEITEIARKVARELCGADGATFVIREGDLCHYVDEDAIEPLWKGKKFPLKECISGWSILNGNVAVIEDIYSDERIPHAAYRPTFVRSLVMVPIRQHKPLGAIGNYWAKEFKPGEECVIQLRALANLVSIALENVQLVQELKASNEVLQGALRTRDEFLSIASHELRTPLSSLKLQIQMLAREVDSDTNSSALNGKLKSATDLSLRQINNLAKLVENLLDVSRIRLQKVELHLTEFDFTQAIRDAVEQMSPQMSVSKLQPILKLQGGIIGKWDETRIEQVVTNLLSNACKYAPMSTVTITTKVEHGCAILIVEDNGPGIRKEHHERIFEQFERDAGKSSVGGLGLGLFITRRLVEAHHGRIRVQSEEGRGASFIAEFPITSNEAGC